MELGTSNRLNIRYDNEIRVLKLSDILVKIGRVFKKIVAQKRGRKNKYSDFAVSLLGTIYYL